jgi:hypothetical protein
MSSKALQNFVQLHQNFSDSTEVLQNHTRGRGNVVLNQWHLHGLCGLLFMIPSTIKKPSCLRLKALKTHQTVQEAMRSVSV